MFKNNFNQKKKKNRSLIAITLNINVDKLSLFVPQQPDVRIVKSIGAFILHCTLENAISIRNRRRVLKRPANCRFPRWKSWRTVIVAGEKKRQWDVTSLRTDAPAVICVSFPGNSHRIFAMCHEWNFQFETVCIKWKRKKERTNGSGKINVYAMDIRRNIHKSRV